MFASGVSVPEEARDGGNQVKRFVKLGVFSVVIVVIAGLLGLVIDAPLFGFSPLESEYANRMLNYQLSALPVVGLALLVTFVFAGKVRLRYLNLHRTGAMRPFFAQPGGGRWESDGWFLGLMMVAIVATVTFFQFLPGGFTFRWAHLALVLPLAAMNAFTEETIFRLPFVTMGENDTSSRTYGLLMGSVVFGAYHYGGIAPNGVVGATMSAFLGFVLAKSMQETRGFFWAFVIHVALDIPILIFALNQTPSP
ncbi:CPBP family intramembrane metalloprotease [Ruania suaedae]|uniref:CPBP family intramembrane glutamic endopeptidase n=1 Tax=Ruania suaedae TaxID=2897774 RepID=UPI001E44E3AE|nr:CPBP family intramembrane glutamic endopeptidase [Ruania suaedae]UFU02309.1 CPBP family intramembrane metalloprotease [Ruania suaedae]